MPPSLETVKVGIENGVATLYTQGGTPLMRLTEILPATAISAADVGAGATDAKGASIKLGAAGQSAGLEGGSVVVSGGSSTQQSGIGGNATLIAANGDIGGDAVVRGGDSLGPASNRGGDATVRGGDSWTNDGGDAILQAGFGQDSHNGGSAILRGGGGFPGNEAELTVEGGKTDGTHGRLRVKSSNAFGDTASVLGGDGNLGVVWKNLKTALLDAEAQAAHCDPATCTAADIANALIAAGLMAPAP